MTHYQDSHAVIATIAQEMQRSKASLGRTKFQKLVFLLSELFGVKTDYQFRFYTYGPFSNELAGDIDYLARIDVLDALFFEDKGFYEIVPGKSFTSIEDEGSIDEDAHQKIAELIAGFGKKNASELELFSTLVYLNKFDEIGRNVESLSKKTRELKPKFTESQVNDALGAMKSHLTLV
jgi:uncharacterized protein